MREESAEDRLAEICRVEYGSVPEVTARLGVIVVAVVAVWLLYGRDDAAIWVTVHLSLQAVYALLLFRRTPLPAPLALHCAIAVYTLSGLNFAAYPLWLIDSHAAPGLSLAGAAALVGQTTYILQRRQLDRNIVISDIFQLTLIVGVLIWHLSSHADSLSDRILLICAPLALYIYWLAALFAGLRHQRLLRETQSRLAASQKARALTQFVGGVAHDFNNQLTAILGHLELHGILLDPKERANALDESRQAARRAAVTVQQLLASSGRTRLSPKQLALAPFLAQLKTSLHNLLDPNMRVTLHSTEDSVSAFVDADVLETCLIQLCLNAQNAAQETGMIRIWVEIRDTLPPQDPPIETKPPYAVIVVEDDGPGVPAEALPLLAEPFYTTKSASEGAGLGLSAVAGFARQSGGGLLITGGPDHGLRVALALPLRPCDTTRRLNSGATGSDQLPGST